MCASGQCSEGYALYAIFENGIGKKAVKLQATTLSEAEQEAARHCGQDDRFLYIESRHVTDSTH